MAVDRGFDQFGYASLEVVSIREVRASSTSVLLVCTYWLGAANQLMRAQGQQDEYANELKQFLQEVLEFDSRAANHLLKTEARLRLKYALLADVFQRGAQAAERWSNANQDAFDDLRLILKTYGRLTLLELDTEGVLVNESTFNLPIHLTQKTHKGMSGWLKWLRWAILLTCLVLLNLWFFGIKII